MSEKIKVLIVDDSRLVSEVLRQILGSDPDFQVVGVASNGKEGVELAAQLKPNLITMDLKMPIMDGYEAVKQIMAFNPTPIVVISSSYVKGDSEKAFRAISIGALEVMDKGMLDAWDDPQRQKEIQTFLEALKLLSRVKVVSHILGKVERADAARKRSAVCPGEEGKIVGIAASTGGPQAIVEVLKKLPAGFPAPILIVQHITPSFEEGLAEWLKASSALNVAVAVDGEVLLPGKVYIAPGGRHLTIGVGRRVSLSDAPPNNGLKPSADLLFASLAAQSGPCAVGVILTGMGSDGAAGLLALKKSGGTTIAQNEETSVVFGMPRAALKLGAADETLPLEMIAEELIRKVGG